VNLELGMGATASYYSDCDAYTVIEILSPKKIRVQNDKAIPTANHDYYGRQEYTFERDEKGEILTLSLRKNDLWIPIGLEKNRTPRFILGLRRKYIDPTF
jgi:hypothetical protein